MESDELPFVDSAKENQELRNALAAKKFDFSALRHELEVCQNDLLNDKKLSSDGHQEIKIVGAFPNLSKNADEFAKKVDEIIAVAENSNASFQTIMDIFRRKFDDLIAQFTPLTK